MAFNLQLGATVVLAMLAVLASANALNMVNPLAPGNDAVGLRAAWQSYKTKFDKNYSNLKDDLARMQRFISTKRAVDEHNKRFEDGEVSYEVEINKFADWTPEEYNRLNGLRLDINKFRRPSVAGDHVVGKNDFNERFNSSLFLITPSVTVPDSWDWREKGYVSPVKNQGNCGSCWAFGATSALESQYKRQTGKMLLLSEQQLVDCAGAYDNNGCDGGMPDFAYDYIKDEGIAKADDYRYTAKAGECTYKKRDQKSKVKVTGYEHVRFEDEEQLKVAVATQGPLVVAIDASTSIIDHIFGTGFANYKSGVFYRDDCSSSDLNHAVVVVGYGTCQYQGDYWIVKNSWGEDWGQQGYIYMARNRGNHCGIATIASLPLV